MNHPIKVGFLSPVLYGAGGTETWHCTLLPGLAEDPRIQITGLGVLSPDECNEETASRISRTCPVFTGWGGLAEVASDADVIVWWGLADPTPFLGDPRPVTIVVSHGDSSFPWTASTLLSCSPHADFYVGVSESAIESIPPNRVHDSAVIYNGIDPEKYTAKISRETQRSQWKLPRDAKVLGVVSRMSDEKDPDALARCIKHLPSEWVGVLVGTGPNHIQTMAHAFGVAGTRVFFPGPTTDVGSAYGAFDVLLCPSTSEGFGLVIVEGLAAGLPVVTTEVGIAKNPTIADLVSLIPINDKGQTIAQSVLKANTKHRWALTTRQVRDQFSSERFIHSWANYLVGASVANRV